MPDGYLYENMDELYKVAEALQGYNALALRAMALWAYEHRKDKDAMRVSSFVWGRNSRLMAKAVDRYGEWFTKDGVSTDEFLSLFAIAQLPKECAGQVFSDWRNYGLPAYAVRDAVAAAKPKRERKATLAERCAILVRSWRKVVNGASVIGSYQNALDNCAEEVAELPEVAKVLNGKAQ